MDHPTPDPPSVPELAERIAALEERVARNDTRLDTLEGWGQETAQELQRNVESIREETRRARWLRTLRR